jgi:hypothetical protein
MAIHAFNGDYIDTEQDNNNCFFNQINKISSSSRLLTYAAAALPIIHGNQNSFNYRFLRDKSVLITCPLDKLNRTIDEFVSNPTGFVNAELASRSASYRKGTDFVRLFLKAYIERYHSCRLYSDAIQAAIETIV